MPGAFAFSTGLAAKPLVTFGIPTTVGLRVGLLVDLFPIFLYGNIGRIPRTTIRPTKRRWIPLVNVGSFWTVPE